MIHQVDIYGKDKVETAIETMRFFEPKHGTWNDHTCINWHGWHCSVCDYETQRKTHYCPNCGARMENGDE